MIRQDLRRQFVAVLLVLGVWTAAVNLPACASVPVTLSSVGSAAYQAARVVKALDVIRDVAIAANAQTPPLMSTADTKVIVTWHEAAVSVIAATPSGWKATVLAGLAQLKTTLPAATYAQIAPYIMLAQTLMAEVA